MTKLPPYQKITEIKDYVAAWSQYERVRVTEKLHGIHVAYGLVRSPEWGFHVESYGEVYYEGNPRWDFLDENMMALLSAVCDESHDVVVYAEIIGPGVFLDYGLEKQEIRVFDILKDDKFLDWDLIVAHCSAHNVDIIPLMYAGVFSWPLMEKLCEGHTTVRHGSKLKSFFKGREGIVVTPIEETYSEKLGGRLIGKGTNPEFETRIDD